AITTLFEKVKDLLNHQTETQRLWNEQIQSTLNERFSKLEQAGLIDDVSNPDNNQPANDIVVDHAIPITVCSPSEKREETPQGNNVSIPTFSNL
ncbi:20826_t:CDS:1, partial [Dentiscutata erythropus]